MEVWKVGKTFLIHRSSSMLWEMIVSNMCMNIEYIRLKHAKWVVWSFNERPSRWNKSWCEISQILEKILLVR
ncbi:hypothetical protein LDENG_00172310 [Lucifuga dentata]|nr:hypothetical protein LDENG_00172310 [Lucifuga dentata]